MGQLLSHPLTEKTIELNDYRAEDILASRSHAVSQVSGHSNAQKIHQKRDSEDIKLPRYYNCVGTMQGYRLTQEDAHLVANNSTSLNVRFYNPLTEKFENLDISIFAVFDGHGGSSCSNFLSADPENPNTNGLAKWIAYSFEYHKYGIIPGSGSEIEINTDENNRAKFKRAFRTMEGLISQILKDAFLLQDQELYKHFANDTCGSTGVVALIINHDSLYVANCGDSRCILSSKSHGVKTMSFDHKPQQIGELIRINNNGGTVQLGRVGGILALSRAFSDFQFKRGVAYSNTKRNNKSQNANRHIHHHHHRDTSKSEYGDSVTNVPPQESQVTVEPDVLIHKLDYDKDEFLILACDGIWDVYSNKQVVQFIKYHLGLGLKLDSIMTKLLNHAIAQANSNTGVGFDNMTAIIVVLNKPKENLSDWYGKMRYRLEREKGII